MTMKAQFTLNSTDHSLKSVQRKPDGSIVRYYDLYIEKSGELKEAVGTFSVVYARITLPGSSTAKSGYGVHLDVNLDEFVDEYPKLATEVLQLMMHSTPDHVDVLILLTNDEENEIFRTLVAAMGGFPLTAVSLASMEKGITNREMKKLFTDNADNILIIEPLRN
jgi:hypothetical protein